MNHRVMGWVLLVGLLAGVVSITVAVALWYEKHRSPQPDVLCRELPTFVVEFGVQIIPAGPDTLLCFRQGGRGAGMTEFTCAPMRKCRPDRFAK